MNTSHIFALVTNQSKTNIVIIMKERINVRGEIKALEINASLTLPKGVYKPSVIRSTAGTVTADEGKVFTVNITDKLITVTRIS